MPTSFLERAYNPDVLSCLANLSNDEVFTPPELANKVLDMLPAELWESPDTKILDPCCKSGIFLREAAKRLIKGLEPVYPDLQERVDHIMHEQLFAISITELTSLLSRRSIYCSKYPNGRFSVSEFDNAEGNVRYRNINHTWQNGRCAYCEASEKEYRRSRDIQPHRSSHGWRLARAAMFFPTPVSIAACRMDELRSLWVKGKMRRTIQLNVMRLNVSFVFAGDNRKRFHCSASWLRYSAMLIPRSLTFGTLSAF